MLENLNKKNNKRKNLQNLILQSVALTGLITASVLAPNVIGAMGKLGLIPNKRQSEFIKESTGRLIKRGYLTYKNGYFTITKEGERYLNTWKLKSNQQLKNRKWDGKWRVLIFDIPEYRRSVRRKVRITLLDIGFLRLQDSVWIYPYGCEEYVRLMKADFKIGKDLLYMIVDHLEFDIQIRKHFNLLS